MDNDKKIINKVMLFRNIAFMVIWFAVVIIATVFLSVGLDILPVFVSERSVFFDLLGILFSTIFLTTSIFAVLSDKKDLVYWEKTTDYVLVNPYIFNFIGLSIIGFSSLIIGCFFLIFYFSLGFTICFNIGISSMIILFFQMTRTVFLRKQIFKELQKDYEKATINVKKRYLIKIYENTFASIEQRNYEICIENIQFLMNRRNMIAENVDDIDNVIYCIFEKVINFDENLLSRILESYDVLKISKCRNELERFIEYKISIGEMEKYTDLVKKYVRYEIAELEQKNENLFNIIEYGIKYPEERCILEQRIKYREFAYENESNESFISMNNDEKHLEFSKHINQSIEEFRKYDVESIIMERKRIINEKYIPFSENIEKYVWIMVNGFKLFEHSEFVNYVERLMNMDKILPMMWDELYGKIFQFDEINWYFEDRFIDLLRKCKSYIEIYIECALHMKDYDELYALLDIEMNGMEETNYLFDISNSYCNNDTLYMQREAYVQRTLIQQLFIFKEDEKREHIFNWLQEANWICLNDKADYLTSGVSNVAWMVKQGIATAKLYDSIPKTHWISPQWLYLLTSAINKYDFDIVTRVLRVLIDKVDKIYTKINGIAEMDVSPYVEILDDYYNMNIIESVTKGNKERNGDNQLEVETLLNTLSEAFVSKPD